MDKVKIEVMADGWTIWIGNRRYQWDHNEPDLGTKALAVLFTDLGHEVAVEEVC
ncbi:MAG: hypothetical protein GY906_23085 [bacterium]|nr:hypothetical protein [bacterium]